MRVKEHQDSTLGKGYKKQEETQMNSETGIKKPQSTQASSLFEMIWSRDTNV